MSNSVADASEKVQRDAQALFCGVWLRFARHRWRLLVRQFFAPLPLANLRRADSAGTCAGCGGR